jgi:cysteine-rich repeat protein
VQQGIEQCDDANTNNTDGCLNNCQSASCGDGFVRDDNGDGVVDPGDEACEDQNNVNGDGCDTNCILSCGNGVVDPGNNEECDDGNTTSSDRCSAACLNEYCGDGIVNSPYESCDDGNEILGDGCEEGCSHCGDGVLDEGEMCDDGNLNYDDGCNRFCEVDQGFKCERIIQCGEGEFGSACLTCAYGSHQVLDEGYTGNDSCGSDFRFERCDFIPSDDMGCTNTHSACFYQPCGDGYIEPLEFEGSEECDDGNTTAGDGCDGCYAEICGNNRIDYGEECDDGNLNDGDGCQSDCTLLCGDGIVDPGQQCDDGNLGDADGCNANCFLEQTTTELEPNEDGSVSTGGNTLNGNDYFADSNPNIFGNQIVLASISPAGDEDVFLIRNPFGTESITMRLRTFNPAFGPNQPCTSIDTVINVRDLDGNLLAQNDDRNTGDRCSEVSYTFLPHQMVGIQVIDYGDNSEIISYALALDF